MTITMTQSAPVSASVQVRRSSRLARVLGAHPVAFVVGVALAVRLVFAVASFLLNSQYLIPDEAQYIDLARSVANGRGAEAWFPGYGQSLYDNIRPFSVPLVLLFNLFGSSRLVAQLWVVPFGVATAGLTTVLALAALPRRWAVGAGLLVALLPSQVLWSSVVLREAMIWACLAVVAVAVLASTRPGRRSIVVAVLGSTVGLFVLTHVREQTAIVGAWSLVLATLLIPDPLRRRLARSGAAVALALVLPWVAGLGPGGLKFVTNHSDLGDRRLELSFNAQSGFVAPPEVTTSIPEPDGSVDEPNISVPAQNGTTPGGASVTTPGGTSVTTAPEQRTTTTPTPGTVSDGQGHTYAVDNSTAASLGHLPVGLVAVAFRPTLLDTTGSAPLRLAAGENLLWCGLYVLGAIGLVRARKHPEVFAYPVIVSGGIFILAALTQGNLGTAFRHRGQVLWALALLAAAGAETVARRWSVVRHEPEPPTGLGDAKVAVEIEVVEGP